MNQAHQLLLELLGQFIDGKLNVGQYLLSPIWITELSKLYILNLQNNISVKISAESWQSWLIYEIMTITNVRCSIPKILLPILLLWAWSCQIKATRMKLDTELAFDKYNLKYIIQNYFIFDVKVFLIYFIFRIFLENPKNPKIWLIIEY